MLKIPGAGTQDVVFLHGLAMIQCFLCNGTVWRQPVQVWQNCVGVGGERSRKRGLRLHMRVCLFSKL